MNSPILEVLASYGIDPAYIIIGLLMIMLILLILHVRVMSNIKRLYRKYDRFMRGRDMESMEDIINSQFDKIEKLEAENEECKEQIERILENIQIVYQKSGLVKYDAFREMSGKLSYALAMLDKNNNGVLINSMYSREGCYSYAKDIKDGKSEINLSEEEEEALKIALNSSKMR